MSLDVRQVRERIIRPTLAALGPQYASESAELLLLGTAAQESGFRALVQYGGGPAVGLWQMEPSTYRDHWAWIAAQRGDLSFRILSFASRGSGHGPPPADEMAWNLRLACAMARIHYWRRPFNLPSSRDARDFAVIWKAHYNTILGKGQPGEFVAAWHRLVSPVL